MPSHHLGLRAVERARCGARWALIAFLLAMTSGAWASTTSVRHGHEQSTLDQPDVVNPVYSHVPAAATLPSADANATAEQLLALFIDRHTAMDYTAAAEAALRLIQAAPDRPHGYYNLSCALARLRRLDEAIAALKQAIDAGWRDARHMMLDPDLAVVRSTDAYRQINDHLAAKIETDRIAASPLRTDGWAIIRADLEAQGAQLLAKNHVPMAVIAVIQDGELAGVVKLTADKSPESDAGTADNMRFRVRRPIELLGLIAGAQLQQRGRLMLAELMEQGAALDREARSRANQHPDRRQAPVIITPVAADESTSNKPSRPDVALRIDPNNATLSLLKLSIEMATGQDFAGYCTQNILEPLGMENSGFERENRVFADATVVSGRTVLGTPLPLDQIEDGPTTASVLYASADDLARVIELMMTGESAAENSAMDAGLKPDPISILARVNAMAPGAGGVGLGVQVRQFESGRRVQVFEVGEGVGCLMRWHPRQRSGVVILFNSESGGDAAQRLAHIALGGE